MQSDWEKFRTCRQTAKRKLREAEREYVQNEIHKNSDETRSMWKVIRSCNPRKETTELNYSRNIRELVEEFKALLHHWALEQQRLQLNSLLSIQLFLIFQSQTSSIYIRYHVMI